MPLTPKQASIIKAMGNWEDGMTPTEIGQACGQDYGRASAWACSTLKSLLNNRIVSKQLRDGKIKYSLTVKGREWAKELSA